MKMTRDQWTIAPLVLATGVVEKSLTVFHRDHGVKKEGPVVAWLLMNGDRKILVDTGIFGPSDASDRLGVFSRTPEQGLKTQLKRFNTSPKEITLVINTHLHSDHSGGNGYFPGARIIVQKREMEYAKHPLPVTKADYNVEIRESDFEILDGDAEIAPGIKIILTPGHTVGSQAVLVETASGLYVIAGDTVPHFENMEVPANEPFWPTGLYIDLRELYESLHRLKSLGGVILPGHDMLVLKKNIYP
jgi:glyoxylase-like metal-dependent hydrolase (beta-lactamase superfamily II)